MEYVTALSESLLTLCQYCSLSSNLSQFPNYFFVPIYKPVQRVWYAHLGAEFLHELLSSAQVVSWHPWKEMVDSLELQATVEKVQPLRTFDIHCCSEHLLRERLVWAELCSAHGEVGQSDLSVKRHRDHVASHEKSPSS